MVIAAYPIDTFLFLWEIFNDIHKSTWENASGISDSSLGQGKYTKKTVATTFVGCEQNGKRLIFGRYCPGILLASAEERKSSCKIGVQSSGAKAKLHHYNTAGCNIHLMATSSQQSILERGEFAIKSGRGGVA